MNKPFTKLFANKSQRLLVGMLEILAVLFFTTSTVNAIETVGTIQDSSATVFDVKLILESYLVAYLFWLEIALGCLALSLLHQLVHGTWGLATSRIFEAGSATLPLMAILFLPIVLGLADLYPWAGSQGNLPEMSASKAAYLSPSGFYLRAIAYFACWLAISTLVNRASLKRDDSQDEAITTRLRRFSGGGLVLLTLTATFASFDWMMSLEPEWYSTMYGALFAMGGVLTGFSFSLWYLSRSTDRLPWNGIDRSKVYADLGSLLLAFVILWTYLAYSQYLIMWSGNSIEEIPWYLKRFSNGWQWVALALVGFSFAVLFLLLLSRKRKRTPRRLARVALGLVIMGYLNMLWMIKPSFELAPYHLAIGNIVLPPITMLDLAMVLGVGAVWIFACRFSYRRHAQIPSHDPAWANVEVHT